MSETTILPIKPGSMSKLDKATLRKAGVVVVEHDNPSELRLLRPGADIDGGDLLRCAIQALNTNKTYASDAREALARHILDVLDKSPNNS